jgi:hypothetical protein
MLIGAAPKVFSCSAASFMLLNSRYRSRSITSKVFLGYKVLDEEGCQLFQFFMAPCYENAVLNKERIAFKNGAFGCSRLP